MSSRLPGSRAHFAPAPPHSPTSRGRSPAERRLTGRHVLVVFLAFFGVIFAVNGVFLYHALGTFTGFATTDAYRKGLRYNETIARADLQDAQGWRTGLNYDRDGRRLLLRVGDARGEPVTGLRVEGVLGRPSTGRHDRHLVLSEVAPGLYAAPVVAEAGQWLVAASLFSGATDPDAEPAHRLRNRLWIAERP